jgi:hypothetical protein
MFALRFVKIELYSISDQNQISTALLPTTNHLSTIGGSLRRTPLVEAKQPELCSGGVRLRPPLVFAKGDTKGGGDLVFAKGDTKGGWRYQKWKQSKVCKLYLLAFLYIVLLHSFVTCKKSN